MNVTIAPGASLRRIAEIVRNAILRGPDAWEGGSRTERDVHSNPPANLLPTDRDVVELFTLLQERETPYLLVGGIAMLRYIEGRNTEDIDLLIGYREPHPAAPARRPTPAPTIAAPLGSCRSARTSRHRPGHRGAHRPIRTTQEALISFVSLVPFVGNPSFVGSYCRQAHSKRLREST